MPELAFGLVMLVGLLFTRIELDVLRSQLELLRARQGDDQ